MCPGCKRILDDYIEANMDHTTDASDLYVRLNRLQKEVNSVLKQLQRLSVKELIG